MRWTNKRWPTVRKKSKKIKTCTFREKWQKLGGGHVTPAAQVNKPGPVTCTVSNVSDRNDELGVWDGGVLYRHVLKSSLEGKGSGSS